MSVQIHGKEYFTVGERLVNWHKDHPKGSITTELISNINGVSVVKATVYHDADFKDRAFTGHASEKEGSTMINKTSALENAETSAIGRALASAGYAGSEFASADEVANAIKQQEIIKHEEKQPAKVEINNTLNVEQANTAKEGNILNSMMGLLQACKERQVKVKDVLKDVTDYTLTSMDGNHKIIVSKWGKTHEGLHQGQVVIMKDVKVGKWKDALTFTAKEVETVGNDTIEVEPKEDTPF